LNFFKAMGLHDSEHVTGRVVGVDETQTSIVSLASQSPFHNPARIRAG
jgi:hypothetical protein